MKRYIWVWYDEPLDLERYRPGTWLVEESERPRSKPRPIRVVSAGNLEPAKNDGRAAYAQLDFGPRGKWPLSELPEWIRVYLATGKVPEKKATP